MNKNKFNNAKFFKICGVVLIACSVVGFFYVMGRNDAKASDVMATIFFFGFGVYALNKSKNINIKK